MKSLIPITATLSALFLVNSAARADEFITTFSSGNPGGWTFGSPNGSIQATGGNPGAFFHDDFLDTFAPQPHTTTTTSLYTGNYRQRDVASVGIDLILYNVDFSADGRPLTVMLTSDNGTPANPNDDWVAYHIGPDNVPLPGEGWKSYDFAIPSQSTTLPAGWSTLGLGPDAPASPNWNTLITNVVELGYFYGDPEFFFIFQGWDLGLDNPRITYTPTLHGDMNCNGTLNGDDVAPFVLAILDPIAFGASGCPISAGDFNGDNRVNIADISLFIQALLAAE